MKKFIAAVVCAVFETMYGLALAGLLVHEVIGYRSYVDSKAQPAPIVRKVYA